MSARSLFTLSLVAAGVLAPAAIADAAKSSAYPTISKIEPMQVSIGETMTITGKGFLKGKAKNTVVFRRSGKPNIFVKADGLSTTRLTVKVPAKVQDSLGKKSGSAVATRFQIRVLAKKFGKAFTTLSKSPTVMPKAESPVTALTPGAAAPGTPGGPAALTPAAAPAPAAAAVPAPDCDNDGTPDATDTDDDNDLLVDTTEVAIGTNRCAWDTDDDGMSDGWEYQSATDLNQRSCPKPPSSTDASWDYPRPCAAIAPYPAKRSYPNPLNSDLNTDYDGDGLKAWMEYKAFARKASLDPSFNTLNGANGMWYSAGKQSSVATDSDTPTNNNCVGQALPDGGLPFGGVLNRPEFNDGDGTYPTFLNGSNQVYSYYRFYLLSRYDGDPCLEDDERDEDGDFLNNYEETTGPMSSPSWWSDVVKETAYQEAYDGTDFLDADSDGDGIVDGLDDSDHDDFLNVEELYAFRGAKSWTASVTGPGPLTGLWVHPFNPCLPNPDSRTCQKHRPGDAQYPPFSVDPNSPRQERWPLYGTPLYGQGTGMAETYTTPDGPDADNEPDVHPIPTEIWTPTGMPAGYDTTAMPPLHPLPRP